MFFTALRIFLLILSFFGYCAALRKKQVPMAFVPILVVSGTGCILFLSGLLNLLPHACALLFGGGLWILLQYKLKKTPLNFSRHDWICLGIFTVICILFAWRVAGTVVLHYDNFTHWLRIVREILDQNRFPNFQSEMIIFQSYPTGSASFSYLICKVIGLESDGAILFSQALIMAAALCSMLAFIREFRFPQLVVFALGCIYCVVANPVADDILLEIVPNIADVSICEVLPDTLVSILSIAALAIVVFYRQSPFRAAWFSLPVQIYLITVKNSGLFMILFNTALLIYFFFRFFADNKSAALASAAKLAGIHCGIPFLVYFLWNRHVAMVFADGNTSRHSVSLEYYRGILGGKSFSQIFEILKVFLQRFFSWSDSWCLLIICLLLFGAVYAIQKAASKEAARDVLLCLLGIVAAYVIFMMAQALMYLASMNYDEAIRLACYDRYEKIIVVYLVGAITVFLLHFLSSCKENPSLPIQGICILAIALIAATQAPRIPTLFCKTNPYEGSVRQFLEQTKEAYHIPDGASCLIFLDSELEDDSGYSGYLAQYVFWSNHVRIRLAPESDLAGLAEEYTYLITQTQDSTMAQFLTEKGLTPGQTVYLLNPAQ